MPTEECVGEAVPAVSAASGGRGPGAAAWLRTFSLALTRFNEEKERTPCLQGSEASADVKMWKVERRVLLDLLLVGWGIGTWLGVNGLYNQLPQLVERLPEGWALPASMVLAVQLGNLGLAAEALLRRLFPHTNEAPYTYALLAIGTLALALNAFLYERTVWIGSSEHSLAFLVLTFFAALVGCTSSVVFYPYMSHFKDIYLTSYLFGEGLSGFIPSIFALIQGVGGEIQCVPSADNTTMEAHYPEARFSTNVFLLVLSGLSALSLASFTCVDTSTAFDSERVSAAAADKRSEAAPRVRLMSAAWSLALLLMLLLSALGNGVLPSVQTYSCMPYGARVYHLSVTLSSAATPAACLLGALLRPLPVRALLGVLAVSVLPLLYVLSTAVLSPVPPLLHHDAGGPLIVIVWVWTSLVVAYARMWVFVWARRGGARGMRVMGGGGQLGSALGSVLLFVLVNYTPLFTQPDVCPPPLSQ